MSTILNDKHARLNELEQQAFKHEGALDKVRWLQAEEISRRQEAGETQAEIARGWINPRTRRPHSRSTVSGYVRCWRRYGPSGSRPAFTDALAAVVLGGGISPEVARDKRRQINLRTTEERRYGHELLGGSRSPVQTFRLGVNCVRSAIEHATPSSEVLELVGEAYAVLDSYCERNGIDMAEPVAA